MNNEDIDFQLITDEDVVAFLLSALYNDINNIKIYWADKVPDKVYGLLLDLHKELQQC
jgi:hypothetical protein